MQDTGSLTNILITFSQIYRTSITNISPYAITLFYTLMALDVAWVAIQHVLNDGSKVLKLIVEKTTKYGIYFWLITTYSTHAGRVLDSFLKIGIAGGGNRLTNDVMTDPSYIIDLGLQTVWPILDTIKSTSFIDLNARLIILILTYFFSVLAYFVIAAQVFITYIEFYIITGVVVFFLPFGVLNKTAFMAEKAIGAIIGVAVKIMMIALILSATFPFLEQLKITKVDIDQCLTFMFAVMVIAYLAAKTPGMAASLLSGHPSLTGGEAVAAGMAATMTLAKVITGGLHRVESSVNALRTTSGGGAGGANMGLASNTMAVAGKLNNSTGLNTGSSKSFSSSVPEADTTSNKKFTGGMTAEGVRNSLRPNATDAPVTSQPEVSQSSGMSPESIKSRWGNNS